MKKKTKQNISDFIVAIGCIIAFILLNGIVDSVDTPRIQSGVAYER